MAEQQYRCIADQVVFPSVEEWRTHALAVHGPRIFEAAGYTTDPQPEPVIPTDDPRALDGVMRIVFGNVTLGWQLHPR